jgi:hypothetical protein
MKSKSFFGGAAAVAVLTGVSLLGAAPAQAAEIYVDLPDPIPAEVAPYAPVWFAGTVAGGTGTAVQGESGLVITGGAQGYQLLNGTPASSAPVTLADALGNYTAVSSIGDAFYQISLFGEGAADSAFTTLRPVVADEPWGNWTTSQSVEGLTANAPYTKDALLAALDAGQAAEVLAFGVFINAGDTVTLRTIAFNGDEYSFYTAQPTLTVSPAKLELKDATKPITLTASGFGPGEDVTFGAATENSGGLIGEAVADADGVASMVFNFEPGVEVGEFTFFANDISGLYGASAPFSITANALAATGSELSPFVVAAGVLLALGGAGAVVFARRSAAKA